MDEAETGWRGVRVLVSGGSGFLGTAVVERLLAAGAEVVGLVRDRTAAGAFARHRLAGRVRILHGRPDDLFRVHSALAIHEIQRVFHFAPADVAAFDRGLTTILEAVRKYDPRVPVTCARGGSGATLLTTPAPLGFARFEELCGPDPEARGAIASIANALIDGTPTFPSDLGPRDYVQVGDAARAVLLLADEVARTATPTVREATFRSGWQFNERELVSAIRDVLNGVVPEVPFLGEPSHAVGWSPSGRFGEHLLEAVNWYRERPRARPERRRVAA